MTSTADRIKYRTKNVDTYQAEDPMEKILNVCGEE